MSPKEILVLVWVLTSWVGALVCHFRARPYYIGPKSTSRLSFSFAGLRTNNYSVAATSIVRWKILFVAMTTCAVATAYVIEHFHGQPR
jgi:hypothetical protein